MMTRKFFYFLYKIAIIEDKVIPYYLVLSSYLFVHIYCNIIYYVIDFLTHLCGDLVTVIKFCIW